MTKSGKAGSTTKSSTKKKRSSTKPKRSKILTKTKGKGFTLGGYGPVGLLTAGMLYGAAKYVARRYFPQAGAYTGAVSAIAAGGTAKVLGTTGKSLFGFGLVELVSELVTDLILPGGLVTAPWVSASRNNGGYQF